MKLIEIEEIKNIFDSIICLAVEGPEVMRCIKVVEKIRKEAEKGYDLADRYLTPAEADTEKPCPWCSDMDLCISTFCPRCGRRVRR